MTLAWPFADVSGEFALLLRATVLIIAAWAAAAALRRAGASAAARHTAWFFGIAALLALPILWWLAPALRLPILPILPILPAEAPPAAALPGLAAPMSTDVAAGPGSSPILALAYALGAAVLVVRLVAGRLMLTRLWRDAGPAPDPAWDHQLSQLSNLIGLSRPVALRFSSAPAVPMTWGTLAPKVLLPAEACQWPPERRRLVLLHELAHVARFDSLSRSLASLACALYWFHPGAWFAARRMRLEQEHSADDRVLMAGGSAKAYALNLLDLARVAGAKPRFDQAAAMAGMYQLERRLVSITGPAPRKPAGAAFLSTSALLAGLTTVLVAAGVPVSASTTDFSSGKVRSFDRITARPEADPRPGPHSPATLVSDNGLDPFSRQSAERRPGEHASAGEQALQRRRARHDQSFAGNIREMRPRDAGGRDRPLSAAPAEPLRDYGWELPRRDPTAPIGSLGDSDQSARLALPKPVYSASNPRIGRPKWARNIPRLARGHPPTGVPVALSQGPLMLSWSLEAGGK